MPVTFSTNYRKVFAPETLEVIDALAGEGYAIRSMLIFIDTHDEETFRDHYSLYIKLGNEWGQGAVEAFLNCCGELDDLEQFGEAYIGEYSSPARMAEDFLESEVDRLDYRIVVDWEETADYLLGDDVINQGKHYFRRYY